MTNEQKALAILNRIVNLCNSGFVVTFQEDMGEHSLIVGIQDELDDSKESYQHFHTYQGLKSEYELLDSLYKNLKYPVYQKEEAKHPIKDF